MIELKLNKRILLVEVPELSAGITVKGNLLFWLSDIRGYGEEELYSGNWLQPIKASEVTEEIAIEIIGEDECVHYGVHPVWQNYAHPEIEDWQEMPNTALWSFKTLLKSHSLSPDRTILIIEK